MLQLTFSAEVALDDDDDDCHSGGGDDDGNADDGNADDNADSFFTRRPFIQFTFD